MNEPLAPILVVEDDYLDSMSLERELRKINVQNPIQVARNGREALNLLRGEGVPKMEPLPALVLLDLNMPRMNGIEFLEAIRVDDELKSLKVFVLTTSTEEADRLAARNLSISGYIEKPVNFDKFGKEGTSLEGFNLFLELLQLKK